MKLSKRTTDILRNFSSINASILIREGNRIATMAISKKILAFADVEETFTRTFGIYELGKFLASLGMMKDPDLDLQEKKLVITGEGSTLEFTYSAPETIVSPPEKMIEMPSNDAEFDLPVKSFQEVIKAAGVLGLSDLVIKGDGTKVSLSTLDPKNPSTHTFSVDLGPCQSVFSLTMKVDALKLMPMDYKVTVSLKKIVKFEGDGMTYFVAAEHAEGK